jgi:uridine kinase
VYERLIASIDSLRASREHLVVAISGFGGAGKSSLANALRDHYGLRDGQVLRLDDFILDRARGEGMLGGFDWARLTGVLEDVRAGRRLHYTPNDFYGVPEGRQVDEELPEVVLVEGVRLLRAELERFFDLTVWIDCPIELATARGKERDRRNGVGEQELAIWEQEWDPKERDYFAAFRPDLIADVVLAPGVIGASPGSERA